MNYTPKYPHRRSIRLKGYDYAQAGLYFITVCCDRKHNPGWNPFASIENRVLHLNYAGHMVEKWYYELENKYPDKRCHEMVVMPNHIHFIIENMAMGTPVRAPLRGRPVPEPTDRDHPTPKPNDNRNIPPYGPDNKKYGTTIGDAMDWFKTMTTNEYIRGVKTLDWPPFNKKLWQRNYYEHIIRDQQSYLRISEYIRNNPAKWQDDKFFE